MNIRLGEWNTETNPDCVHYYDNTTDCADPIIETTPEEIIPHPDFNRDGNNNNDIGLIRLACDIEFSYYIGRVCLPSPQLSPAPNDKVVVSGWGRTMNERSSIIKQKLFVNIANQQYCDKKFKTVGRRIKSNQICAGGELMKDSCQGDSGGPLMRLVVVDDEEYWILDGIVSYGYRCGSQGWPGVYTRVESYLDWISDNVH